MYKAGNLNGPISCRTSLAYSIVSLSAALGQQSNRAVEEIGQLAASKKAGFVLLGQRPLKCLGDALWILAAVGDKIGPLTVFPIQVSPMFRLLCWVVFLACSLLPPDALAQRRKKSIISGGSPDEKVETTAKEKKADIFDRPVARKAAPAAKTTKAMVGNKGSGELEDGELPEPEIVIVNSRLPGTEGINLSCTLFMSANSENRDESKLISPMILVHDWGGSKSDLAPLARHLQSSGHTVLVPDLRGHGRSTTIVNQTETVDYSKFRKSDFVTVGQDLEACKRYLMQFNNEGKLNISMLSMLAVGDMCPIVTEWVLRDWSFASRGRIKQGKDVQALTLVSPKRKFKTFSMSQLTKAPLLSGKGAWHIPTLVIWGGESASAKETKAVYKSMAKYRPPSEAAMSVDRWAQQDLYQLDLPVALEGAELLRPNEALYRFIATFNQQKILLNAAQFPWQSRAKKKTK